MFVLAEFKDTIQVLPKDLSKPKELAIEDEINLKYGNKVFHNVGLGICVYDLAELGDGIVQHTIGSTYYKVCFTMVVFRPFVGEVLVGTIVSSTRDAVRVSTTFFDDILIPPHLLPFPRSFDETDQVWIWEYDDQQLYLDVGEVVRIQVQSVEFKQIRPDIANRQSSTPGAPKPTAESNNAAPDVPFKVIADMNGSGFGPLSWWMS